MPRTRTILTLSPLALLLMLLFGIVATASLLGPAPSAIAQDTTDNVERAPDTWGAAQAVADQFVDALSRGDGKELLRAVRPVDRRAIESNSEWIVTFRQISIDDISAGDLEFVSPKRVTVPLTIRQPDGRQAEIQLVIDAFDDGWFVNLQQTDAQLLQALAGDGATTDGGPSAVAVEEVRSVMVNIAQGLFFYAQENEGWGDLGEGMQTWDDLAEALGVNQAAIDQLEYADVTAMVAYTRGENQFAVTMLQDGFHYHVDDSGPFSFRSEPAGGDRAGAEAQRMIQQAVQLGMIAARLDALGQGETASLLDLLAEVRGSGAEALGWLYFVDPADVTIERLADEDGTAMFVVRVPLKDGRTMVRGADGRIAAE